MLHANKIENGHSTISAGFHFSQLVIDSSYEVASYRKASETAHQVRVVVAVYEPTFAPSRARSYTRPRISARACFVGAAKVRRRDINMAAVVVGPRAPIRGTLSPMVALPALVHACAANHTVPLVGFYHDQAIQHVGRLHQGVSIFLTDAGRAALGGHIRIMDLGPTPS
jgi:hypothetical protein